jgi:rhodanese-related sulfurtransferase
MGLFDFLRRRSEPTISTEELRAKMQRGDRFFLVEALAEHAYQKGHLPGALSLPRAKVAQLAPTLLPDKGAEIVVYCRNLTCRSAGDAARALVALGYARVAVYPGGKEAWGAAGLPMEASPS